MFREIELDTFRVEAVLQDYLLRAEFQPRGDLLAYLNDRNWQYISFRNCEVNALAADRRVGVMQQEVTTVNKHTLSVLSVLDKEQSADVHLQVTTRPVVFYLGQFAVQGQLHVPSDAPDEDLLDELHDFFPISDASIYSILPVASQPKRGVPLLFVNRMLVQTYHVLKKE